MTPTTTEFQLENNLIFKLPQNFVIYRQVVYVNNKQERVEFVTGFNSVVPVSLHVPVEADPFNFITSIVDTTVFCSDVCPICNTPTIDVDGSKVCLNLDCVPRLSPYHALNYINYMSCIFLDENDTNLILEKPSDIFEWINKYSGNNLKIINYRYSLTRINIKSFLFRYIEADILSEDDVEDVSIIFNNSLKRLREGYIDIDMFSDIRLYMRVKFIMESNVDFLSRMSVVLI